MSISADFLTTLIIDLEDVCSDIIFDIGADSVPEEKLRDIIKRLEDEQDEV